MSSLAEIVTEPTAAVVLSDALLSEGFQEFGIERGLTAEELFDVAVQSHSTALYQSVRAGIAFCAAQEALKITESDTVGLAIEDEEGSENKRLRQSQSTFKSWIKSRGLTEERVYESIRLARGYLAIPAAQRKSYLSLGKYKAIKLASIEPEALADLAESDPEALDAMALLSRSELIKRINNLSAVLETEQSRNQRLLDANQKPRLTTFAPRTEAIRAECLALQAEAALPMDALQKLFNEVLADPAPCEATEQLEQVWMTAQVLAARASTLIEALKAIAPRGMSEGINAVHMMTPAEACRWLLDYSLVENKFEANKALRQARLDEVALKAALNSTPRGRGRPKSSAKAGV